MVRDGGASTTAKTGAGYGGHDTTITTQARKKKNTF